MLADEVACFMHLEHVLLEGTFLGKGELKLGVELYISDMSVLVVLMSLFVAKVTDYAPFMLPTDVFLKLVSIWEGHQASFMPEWALELHPIYGTSMLRGYVSLEVVFPLEGLAAGFAPVRLFVVMYALDVDVQLLGLLELLSTERTLQILLFGLNANKLRQQSLL